jgi:hypothetical protein
VAKKSISLKALLQDLKSGMDDAALMKSHDLTAEQLETVFRKAVEKGGIAQKQLDSLRQAAMQTGAKTSLREPRKKEQDSRHTEEALTSEPLPPPAKSAASRTEKAAGPETVSAKTQPSEEAPQTDRRRFPIKILILLLLIPVLAGFIVMVKFLPWWASVVIVIAACGLALLLGKYLLKKLFMTPFKLKGKALSGADVTVHGVTPASLPDLDVKDSEADSESKSLHWYYVDATITPKDHSGSFTHWEPGELALVSMAAKSAELEDEEHEVAQIHDYRIFSEGSFREDEVYKHPGPQRIQFHVGVKPGESILQFRYYFELFGKVDIPSK